MDVAGFKNMVTRCNPRADSLQPRLVMVICLENTNPNTNQHCRDVGGGRPNNEDGTRGQDELL